MNKSGMFLATETLKMVIAVICLVFLVYLLGSIYYASKNTEKKVQAEATLERMDAIINRIKLEHSGAETVTDVNPSGWFVYYFARDDGRPNACAGEECLCFCDKLIISSLWKEQTEECDENGACLIINNLMDYPDFEIGDPTKNPTNFRITKREKYIEVKKI